MEQSSSYNHSVSVESNTGPVFRLPPKTTGVGDVDDFGSSSAVDALEDNMQKVVDALEENMQKVYNFT